MSNHFAQGVLKTLEGAARTYEERNAVYKDNFRVVGRLMSALFPAGAPLNDTEEKFNRWHIFELIIVKLTRYAQNYEQGGHADSIDDMIVYLGILKELDNEFVQARQWVQENTPPAAPEHAQHPGDAYPVTSRQAPIIDLG